MTPMRYLLGTVLAGVLGGSAAAQSPVTSYPPAVGSAVAGVVPPPPAAAPVTAPPASPTALLTTPPTGLPQGSIESPWVGGRRAGDCCGPVGANGPIGYELYVRTGPNLIVGGEDLGLSLTTGWTTAGGGRALFFNPAGDRAWVLDLGLSYTYNEGKDQRVLGVFTPAALDQNTNEPVSPDEVNSFFIRGLHRTNFNFAVGRDWFLRGAGNLGMEPGPNWRVGGDVGGHWGTSHVDLLPVSDPGNYLRKTSVTHGVFLGTHATYERPLGAYILFGGMRAQWGYTWANLIAPVGSDVVDVNLLLTAGVRY